MTTKNTRQFNRRQAKKEKARIINAPCRDTEADIDPHPMTTALRLELNKQKKYRTTDGKEFISTDLKLIIRRACKELRLSPSFDNKLFALILDRLEGKVKEPIDVEGLKEVAHELNAHEVILSRLGGLILARGHSEDGRSADSRGSVSDTVRLESLGQN